MTENLAAQQPFVWPSRVYYEDTDTSGVVYHANYLKYFERARTEWLRSLGVGQETLKTEHGAVFALRRLEVDHLRSARLDDLLDVSVAPVDSKRVSFTLDQEARRGGELIARARVKVACLGFPGFAPRVLPAFLKQLLPA